MCKNEKLCAPAEGVIAWVLGSSPRMTGWWGLIVFNGAIDLLMWLGMGSGGFLKKIFLSSCGAMAESCAFRLQSQKVLA